MSTTMTSQPVSGSVEQELSQAKARLGVCLFALAYVAGWSYFTSPVSEVVLWVLVVYSLFSAGWVALVRLRPGDVTWRKVLVIFSDLGINTFSCSCSRPRARSSIPSTSGSSSVTGYVSAPGTSSWR